MSKKPSMCEFGSSPIEDEVSKLCCDLVESVSNENSQSFIGLGESWDYRTGKKITWVESFPFLREDILKFLRGYFMDKPGPREYDYYLEKIYDAFRVNKMMFKEEGKWNLDGLTEFLRNADLTEILRKCPSESNIETIEAVDDSTADKIDEDDHLEYLCNKIYGITLDELRALEERGSDIEYWPGPEKFTSKGEVSVDDKMTPDDLVDIMTPEDLADIMTPDDLADETTPEHLADEKTPEDLAVEMTPDDLADEMTPVHLSHIMTPEDLAGEMMPDDLADEKTPEDLAEDVSSRDHSKPVFKEEKSTEDPEVQPKKSEEKSKKKKKRCSWLKKILCCFNCFKCAKSEDD